MLSALLLSALALSFSLHSSVLAQGSRSYTVINRCPAPINVYIGGSLDTPNLASGGMITRTLGVNAGFFYTDANGGSVDGKATRVGFYGDNGSNYYYIVKDVNAFNTGMHIQPSYPPGDGFCLQVACNAADCPDVAAYTSPPTRFPPPSQIPPPYPTYACPHENVAYNVTFCPTGAWPEIRVGGGPLVFGGNRNKCVDVRGNVQANGTPVQIYDCNGTGAQRWVFNRGDTKFRLANTNFCLDAGSNPASGVGMKIWQCIDNLPAQKWIYGAVDNRIVMFPPDPSQCLDLPNGNTANGNQLQTWQCTGANPNQAWFIG